MLLVVAGKTGSGRVPWAVRHPYANKAAQRNHYYQKQRHVKLDSLLEPQPQKVPRYYCVVKDQAQDCW